MTAKVLPLGASARTLASAALRRARFAAGLTQEEAGRLLGVDARQVRRWENGEVSLGPLELLVRLTTGRTLPVQPSLGESDEAA